MPIAGSRVNPFDCKLSINSPIIASKSMACPACSYDETEEFLDLGSLPTQIGVKYEALNDAKNCPRGSIRLSFCPACSFVFNSDFSSDSLDYSEPYDNNLGASSLYREYEQNQAYRLVRTYGIYRRRIVEIGCGSGSFLRTLCTAGDNQGLGYDPSLTNPGLDPSGRIEFIRDFYPGAGPLQPADLIICRQVFEHLPNPQQFLARLRTTLYDSPDTILFFDVPSFDDVLRRMTFWTIIYEHCCYYGQASLKNIFERCGFEVLNIADCFGDTFLGIEVRPNRYNTSEATTSSKSETHNGERELASERISIFVRDVQEKLSRWRQQIETLSREKKRIIAWGAGGRAVSFFNLLNIVDEIPFIVDLNASKAMNYLPGTAQQIVSPEFLLEYRPDSIFIMNGIYREEIAAILRKLQINAELYCV